MSNWGELRGYYGIPQKGDLSDDLTKELINGYYASVSFVDTQMGRVMQTLEELNLRQNTIIVFMSDHGWKLGEYGAWCKHTNFEHDVKVPLIISRETNHIGRVVNERSNALVENIDVFPTIAAACNLTMPKTDGKSLLPLLDNPKMKGDNAAYSVYPRGKNMGCTSTDGQWRYTEWRNADTQEVVGKELYNHKESALATTNLAGKKEYKKVEKKMKKLLDTNFHTDSGSFNKNKTIEKNVEDE